MLQFRLFGIPCQIGLQFWIASFLLNSTVLNTHNGPLKLVLWILCLLVSIVVHELGHALVGRRFGADPYVLLYAAGGLTYLPGASFTRNRSILVSLAGPAMGFALWLLVVAVDRLLTRSSILDGVHETTYFTIRMVIHYLYYINGFWTCMNLLPILPLDGGQVLRAVLGPARNNATQIIGMIFAGAVCICGVLYQQYFIAIFFGYLAYSNYIGDTRSFTGWAQRE